MTSPTTLEQSFIDLAAAHGLRVVSVGISLNQAADRRFNVAVHWDGYSRDGNPCNSGNGPDIATALARAIEGARIDRIPLDMNGPALADEALPIVEVAR